MRQQGDNMARIEIPALYRLDVGSSTWGWHKMEDLVTAVNGLLDQSPLDPMSLEEIGRTFIHLNKDVLFTWSDDDDVGFAPFEYVQWDKPNLFVPAQWGMRVISEIKRHIAAC
jgi:hypothetical protein